MELYNIFAQSIDSAGGCEKGIHQLIEKIAYDSPLATALISVDGQSCTFSALNKSANKFAHYFREQGISPGTIVSIYLHRSFNLIAVILGILKCGACYIPLDSIYPKTRLKKIILEAASPFLITEENKTDFDVDGVIRIRIDDLASKKNILDHSSENLNLPFDPHSWAAIMYTSGSMGKPKGVIITHQAIILRSIWSHSLIAYSADEIAFHKSALFFVDSLIEIFSPLIHQTALLICPDQKVRDYIALAEMVQTFKVTRLYLVPTLLQALIEHLPNPFESLKSVKVFYCTGEPLTAALVRKFKATLPYSKLLNMYGSSEVLDVTCFDVDDLKPEEIMVPIGKPIVGAQLWILDEQKKPVNEHDKGDLYLSSPCLSPGYLNNAELTKEKFLKYDEVTLFNTGDQASLNADGYYIWHGRKDLLIKIKGQLVELTEVEYNLKKHPKIDQACVIPCEDDRQKLLAYIVLKMKHPVNSRLLSRELYAHVSQLLPSYMVPSEYIIIENMPLTGSGKIDYQKLREMSHSHSIFSAFNGAETDVEKAIAILWSEFLPMAPHQIDTEISFFQLGGDSHHLSLMTAKANELFKMAIDPQVFILDPTIKGLAKLVSIEERWHNELQAQNYRGALKDAAIQTELVRFIVLHQAPIEFHHKNILITGAEGFLGGFLLNALLQRTYSTVYCVVDEDNTEHAMQKILVNAKKYGLKFIISEHNKIKCLSGLIKTTHFGLSEETYHDLTHSISEIIHCPNFVDPMLSYQELRDTDIASLEKIIRLSAECNARLHYISTTDCICAQNKFGLYTEAPPPENPSLSFNGYKLAKWVAERLLHQASQIGLQTQIYRLGNISGRFDDGRSNCKDNPEWILLATMVRIKLAPHLSGVQEFTPVDFLSELIIKIALRSEFNSGTFFNMANPNVISWEDYIFHVNRLGNYDMTLTSPEEWKKQIKATSFKEGVFPLLAMFYCEDITNICKRNYTCDNTLNACQKFHLFYPKDYVYLIIVSLNFLKQEGFLPPSHEHAFSKRYVTTLNYNELPKHGAESSEIISYISGALSCDVKPSNNLATFGTTSMDEEAMELIKNTLQYNFINLSCYHSLSAIEQSCVKMIGTLCNLKQEEITGISTVGSSEAVLITLMNYRTRWQKIRQNQGLDSTHPNMVGTKHCHICWHISCQMLGIEFRAASFCGDRYDLNVEEMMSYVDEHTLCVCTILGCTFLGSYDPVEIVNDRLLHLFNQTGLEVPLHVDAASGGFVAPFAPSQKLFTWDFRNKMVWSINLSGHKFGLVYPSIGWLIFRGPKDSSILQYFESSYLGGKIESAGINYSRPAAFIVAQFYQFLRLGVAGYEDIIQYLLNMTEYLHEKLETLPEIRVISQKNRLPVVVFCLKNQQGSYDEHDLSNALKKLGDWYVPVYSVPINANRMILGMRIVVRKGFTSHDVNLFLHDMRMALDFLNSSVELPRKIKQVD